MLYIPFSVRPNSYSWDDPDQSDVMLPDSYFALHGRAREFSDADAVASSKVDWKETPTEHVIKADLPGLKKVEVQVQVEDGKTLSISGQRKKEEVQKTNTWHRVERSAGKLMRKFRLPENAKLDDITAKMENGVLTVAVPKEEKQCKKTRSIEISGYDGEQQLATEVKIAKNTAALSSLVVGM